MKMACKPGQSEKNPTQVNHPHFCGMRRSNRLLQDSIASGAAISNTRPMLRYFLQKILLPYSFRVALAAFVILTLGFSGKGQTPNERLTRVNEEVIRVNRKLDSLLAEVEQLKLQKNLNDVLQWGLPETTSNEEVITHSAIALVYDENHEQAKWVAHLIPIDVEKGSEGRSNDFRPDPKIKTGSAVEKDYFLKTPKEGGGYTYDGFGFDRGHLAPSADFRYSKQALSESFYYSNMSPQTADLNRGRWADLEDALRAYVIRNKAPIYVVTGGVLHPDLKRIERGVNKVSIPTEYYKVALDLENQRAIAFVMPNKKCEYPVMHYACTIDSVEKITGINFFHALDDEMEERLESKIDRKKWIGERELGDVLPLKAEELPRNTFNTVQASHYAGKNEQVKVCGTVVSTKKSAKGNIFLNLDKQFPNQIFSVSIFSDYTSNFSYEPEEFLKGREVCVTGKVTLFNGTPTMNIQHEKAVQVNE